MLQTRGWCCRDGWPCAPCCLTADARSSPWPRPCVDVCAAGAVRRVHQTLRLGRLSAYERTASLLIELHERLRRSGAASEAVMPLPLTQEMLADLLGLSIVHVNRILQQLRRENLIVYRSKRVQFPNLAALVQAAGHGGF